MVSLRADNPDSGAPAFSFDVGERLAAAEGTLAGLYSAAVDGEACSGRINLLAERETDALLTIEDIGACAITAEGSHHSSEPHVNAAIGGRVVGAVPANSMIRAVSKDDPPNAVPEPQAPDEGGAFYFASLLPGRYEINLMSGATVLDQETVEIWPGQETTLQLRPGA